MIELLVVIAIISLLVSILLPSLNRAKDLARRVVCMSREKGIGIASITYADENDEYFPYTMDSTRYPSGSTVNPELVSLLDLYIDDQVRMYWCPGYYHPFSDDDLQECIDLGLHIGYYYFNCLAWTYEDGPLPAGHTLIGSPERVLMNCRQDWFHDGIKNYLFFDGHVEPIVWDDSLRPQKHTLLIEH